MKNCQGKLASLSNGRDAMSGKETNVAPTKRNPIDFDLIVIRATNLGWECNACNQNLPDQK